MEKPSYEYDALKKAVIQRDKNIAAFQEAINKEMQYKAELLGYIKQHEAYQDSLRREGNKIIEFSKNADRH